MCTKQECKSEYAQVFHFIQSHRNGEVVDSMKARGIEYSMSYGLSINQISSFAKTLTKDNELAQKLWDEPMRETKLFALYLFDPQTLLAPQIETIVAQLHNTELVEQAVFVCLSKADILAESIANWCLSDNQLTATTGVTLVTRKALLRKDLTDEYFGTFFATLAERIPSANKPLQMEIAKALLALARRSAAMKAKVQTMIDNRLIDTQSVCLQIVTDELQYV